uniref:Uncharacterized protein n=1 Tax=Anguilla anguilla TaxID=7936 RepID=A0A0E9PE62_ANGAN
MQLTRKNSIYSTSLYSCQLNIIRSVGPSHEWTEQICVEKMYKK